MVIFQESQHLKDNIQESLHFEDNIWIYLPPFLDALAWIGFVLPSFPPLGFFGNVIHEI